MGRKKHNHEDEEENEDWGTGQFSSHLLDKLDDEQDDDDNDEDFVADVEDDTEKPELEEGFIIEGGEETDTDEEAPKKRKTTMKSKLIGKHSLKYDTIYKGKKEPAPEEHYSEHIIKNAGGSLDVDDSDIGSEESKNNIDNFRDSELKERIYGVLYKNTDIKFHAHMRKPAKTDFNAYFTLLIKDLAAFGYTKTEIFIELSGYFSPNVWNMFLLLDKRYGNMIIKELAEKRGMKDIDKMDFIS